MTNISQSNENACLYQHTNGLNKNHSVLKGWWKFENGIDANSIADSSGNNNILITDENIKRTKENSFSAVILDGGTQWLGTTKPVLSTDKSFSVVAWVRLDSTTMGDKLALKPNTHALTAVSQDSPTHSGFYLGVRQFKNSNNRADSGDSVVLNWSFTLAPVDMKDNGVHARSKMSLDESILNKWVMLVGVCDVEKRVAHLYIPEIDEVTSVSMPKEWVCWSANGGLFIGRGHWLMQNVDQWPGRIGPVRVFSGTIDTEDAKKLYIEDTK